MEWIGLIDCNNFFVSCERLFRPDLKKKPVMVLSSNDGCVVARSQEVKDSGIMMGVPVFKIKDIIKDIDATLFSSHFALYRDISRRVFEVVQREFDTVEQYSIDESFFTFKADKAEAKQRIKQLKDRVEAEVGIPVSVGLASSKTLAKYANQVAKKTDGLFVLTMEDWQSKTARVALKELWGVGYRSAESYKQSGLRTVGDLLALERRQVAALFGVVGVRLWLELQGIPTSTVDREYRMPHSILHSRSFKNTTSELSVLKDAVAYHVREASADLRAQSLKTRVLQVTISTSRHGDFFLQGGSKDVVFSAPTSDVFVLLKAAARLVEELYKPGVPYKKAGILLYDFVPEEVGQLAIFQDTVETVTGALTPLIDNINHNLKQGSKLLVGSYLKHEAWEAAHTNRSPAYTTAWKDIAVVKA